jgi:hypothetical protein
VYLRSTTGERLPSGAATSSHAGAPECSSANSDSWLAAPEDGRSPSRRHNMVVLSRCAQDKPSEEAKRFRTMARFVAFCFSTWLSNHRGCFPHESLSRNRAMVGCVFSFLQGSSSSRPHGAFQHGRSGCEQSNYQLGFGHDLDEFGQHEAGFGFHGH